MVANVFSFVFTVVTGLCHHLTELTGPGTLRGTLGLAGPHQRFTRGLDEDPPPDLFTAQLEPRLMERDPEPRRRIVVTAREAGLVPIRRNSAKINVKSGTGWLPRAAKQAEAAGSWSSYHPS